MVYEVRQDKQTCWIIAFEDYAKEVLKPFTPNLSTIGDEVHIKVLNEVKLEPNTRKAIIEQGGLEKSTKDA